MLRLKTFGGLAIQRDGAPVEGAGAQRRRLALLALLAAAGDRGMSREKVLGMLWPDSDPDRGRKNLAQAVYALRRDLGAEEVITGSMDLRVNPDLLSSDLAEFRAAVLAGRDAEAVARYYGPFLDGLYLDEAPEFERWADTERQALAHEYIHALERLARAAPDPRAALPWWRKLANADPLSAPAALGLMRALAGAGDRGAALQHYRVYEMLLRQELDLVPDPEIRGLAEELRRNQSPAAPPAPVPPAPAPPRSGMAETAPREVSTTPPVLASAAEPNGPETPAEPVPLTTQPKFPAASRRAAAAAARGISGHTDEYARPRPISSPSIPPLVPPGSGAAPQAPRPHLLRRRSTRWGMLIGFGIGLLVVFGVVRMTMRVERTGSDAHPIVAVGRIQDYTNRDAGLGRPLADMLATDLARARDLQVISTARMYELLSQEGGSVDSVAAIMRAARAAGATQLLDGALYQRPDGTLRLDLRRADLASGSVIQSYTAESADLFGLVDEARKGMGRVADTSAVASLADVTTRSLTAYRLYEEGIRALFAGNLGSARTLLDQALAEDSTFAMAAYYRARASGGFNDVPLIRGLERAMRLSTRATERERLTIRAAWASTVNDPSAYAVAESLTVLYPSEPDGYLWLGQAQTWAADFFGAIRTYRRVLSLDSVSLRRPPTADAAPLRCYGCEAYLGMIAVYQMADSLPAAIRTAREWTRIQPKNPSAWGQVSWTLMVQYRFGEALAADQQVTVLAPDMQREGFRAQVAFRAGDYDVFDKYFSMLMDGPIPEEGAKWMSLSLRAQGRPHAALGPARRLRALESVSRKDAAPYNALFEAQVWFDLGEYRHAAALFDSISRAPRDTTRSQVARHRVWTETLRATALAAAGDTAPLPALADSVERWGHGSAYARDQRLHHHIRGLLYAARGQLNEAANEFRASVFSPVIGYSRTNVELAKVYLRLNRPRDAAWWAEAALRGGFDATGSYVTQTELAEIAGTAWDAAGQRDSAVARYRQVVHNWVHSEPAFAARLERARLRLAVLEK